MSSESNVHLVVGLGNPGPEYARTRHNVGWMVLDQLRQRWGLGKGRRMFGGLLWDARVDGESGQQRVLLLEPHTYMNRSGQAVATAAGFYKVPPERVLVVLDDMALEPGRIRARPDGSAGGHNGLSDVLRALGTNAVPRLRIGIGGPPPQVPSVSYVLSAVGADEIEAIGPALSRAATAVEDWVFRGMGLVMNQYNRIEE
jgi:PTH1 family peptidyl-tRNA hydrolase